MMLSTSMTWMFAYSGRNANTWEVDGLEDWDTSNVTIINDMFNEAAVNATTVSIRGIENWDASNFNSLSYFLYNFGRNASTFTLDLSSWNVSKRSCR